MYSNNPPGSSINNSSSNNNTQSLQQASQQLSGHSSLAHNASLQNQTNQLRQSNLMSDSAAFAYQHETFEMNNAQKKAQKQGERLQEIEKAAKTCDSEYLQNIIEDAGEDAFGSMNLNRALLQAVQNCSSNKKNEVIECIRILLNAGANVDAQDPTDGKTALMIACEKGYIEVVDCLIQQEAQVNLKDRKQRSSIMYAIEANAQNSDVVMQLIKKGADVNVASIDGWSPLLKATIKQYHEILSKLVEKGANLSQKLLQNHNTALHLACENGDIEALGILIGAGSQEFDTLNKEKETPIMIAERNASKGSQYQITYNYLKHIMDQREQKAQQVKDELVKQEDLKAEKESKKQSNKIQQKQQKESKQQHHQQQQQQQTITSQRGNNNDNEQQYSNNNSPNKQFNNNNSLSARVNPSPKIIQDEGQQQPGNINSTNSLQNDTRSPIQQQQQFQMDYYANANKSPNNNNNNNTIGISAQQQNADQRISHSAQKLSEGGNQLAGAIGNNIGSSSQNISPKKSSEEHKFEQKYVVTNQTEMLPINNRRSPIAPNITYQKNSQNNNMQKKNTQNQNPFIQNVANTRSQINSNNQNLGSQQNQQFQQQQMATLLGMQLPPQQQQQLDTSQQDFNNNNRQTQQQQQQQQQNKSQVNQNTANPQNINVNNKSQSHTQTITNQPNMLFANQQLQQQANSQQLPNYTIPQLQHNNNSNNANTQNNQNSRNQGHHIKKNQSLPYQTLGNQPLQQQQQQTQQQSHSPQIHPQNQNNPRYQNPLINLSQTGALANPNNQLLMGGLPQQIGATGYLPIPGMMNQIPPQQQNMHNMPGLQNQSPLTHQNSMTLGQQQQNIGGSNQQLQPNAQNQSQNKQQQNQLPTNMMPTQQHSMTFPSHHQSFQHQIGIITQQPVPMTQTAHGQQFTPLLQSMNLNGTTSGSTNPTTNTGLPLQNQSNFQNQQNSNIQSNSGSGGTSGANTRSVIQQQPQRQLPIRDYLDLNDENDQKNFILTTQKIKLEKKLKTQMYKISQLEQANIQLHAVIADQNQKLEDADKDIQQRMINQNRLELQNYNLAQEKAFYESQINQMKETQKVQNESASKMKYNIEKVLMNIIMQQKSLFEMIQSRYESKSLLEETDLQEAQKYLNESQEHFNNFLIVDSNPVTQLNQSQIGYSGQGAPSAQVDKQNRPNMLLKMIERYETYTYQHQDTKDHHQRLHEEILLFRESVRDILHEMQPIKEQLIKNIGAVIKKAIPNSEVKVYGSHATKLCLPWSDIDLVIKINSTDHYSTPKHVLSVISRELQSDISNKWIHEVKFVENASVPVVKVKCQIDPIIQQLGISSPNLQKYQTFLEQPFSIDITQLTDNHNGLECVKLVQEFLNENEVIEPLILVLKQYLKVLQYNDPYFGGLSSYALFLMIVSYLQSRQVPKTISQVNLGQLLLEMFQFYGEFQYLAYGIYTHLPGKVPEKANYYAIVNFMSQIVQIDDPLHNHNNVGKSSFKFHEIKDSFKFTAIAAYTGCFCDQHHEKYNSDKARQAILENLSNTTRNFSNPLALPGQNNPISNFQLEMYGNSGQHKKCLGGCDSILSKIIYSYMQYMMHTP